MWTSACRRRTLRPVAACAAGLIAGCANLDPRLVTGRESVPPEGLRFYMTRPFVVVHRPFPIEARAYLVSGTISADGRFVQLTGLPEEFRQAVPAAMLPDRIPTGGLLRLAEEGPLAQSGTTQEPEDEGDEPGPDAGKSSGEQKVGYSNYTVTTDLSGLAVMPMNDVFSIAFLPDYDREFVVETKGKLGVTRLNLSLGPGSSLLGMSGESDNTAWAQIVLDSIRSLATAGTDRLVGLISGAAKDAKGATAQSERATEYRRMAGESVTLRAHVVKMATIGMYPIAKPGEVTAKQGREEADRSARTVAPVERAYQVPYEYFEVVLFEHVVSDAVPYLLTIGARPANAGTAAQCAGKLPAKGLDAAADRFLQSISDSRISRVRFLKPVPSLDCADTITVRITANGMDADEARKIAGAAFAKTYPDTQPLVELAQ